MDILININEITTINSIKLILNNYRQEFVDYKTGEHVKKRQYRTLSIEEILKFNAGICYDVTALENYIFKLKFPNIWHRCYYTESDGGSYTHAFLLYKDFDHKYKFIYTKDEAGAWYTYAESFSLYSVLYKTEKKIYKYNDVPFAIFEYTPPTEIHLTIDDFRNYIFKNGTVMVNKLNYIENVCIPFIS